MSTGVAHNIGRFNVGWIPMPIATDQPSDITSLLSNLGLPTFLIDSWASQGITELLPIQLQALREKVLDHESSLIVGPTSCGKTFIGELVCICNALRKKRAIYLVPFKALAEEKYADFTRKYSNPTVGARVAISTHDRRDHDRRIADGDFDIAILTYEKLSTMIVTSPGIVQGVGAVIVDEVQMVSDPSRGANLELLLTRLRQLVSGIQIIGLSAVVSELNGFDRWLNARVIRNDHRPVTLREGVITPDGQFKYQEWDGESRANGTDSLPRVHGDNAETMAVSLAADLLQNPDEQVLLFANTVAQTMSLAQKLADATEYVPPAKTSIEGLASIETSECAKALTKCLGRSVAFHNGDLTLEERLAVEDGFRRREIRCIVSTTTLSMGVNLPASSVIIVSSTRRVRKGGTWSDEPISVAEYRNMSGRAGRFGLLRDAIGKSFLIATSRFDQHAAVVRYVDGTTEPLRSAFLQQPLARLLLTVFASGLCDTADGARRFLLHTFAALTEWQSDGQEAQLDVDVKVAVTELQSSGLIAINAKNRIVVTDVGRVCASSGLALDTFQKLFELVKDGNTSANDLAYVGSQCEDTGPVAVSLRFSTEEYRGRTIHLMNWIRQSLTEEHGVLTESLLDGVGSLTPPYDMAKAFKYHAAAMAFVSGVASFEIENQLGVSGARARSIGSNCSWLADTASKIAWTTGLAEKAMRYEILSDRFSHGCSEAALLLARIPNRLHRSDREQLIRAGFDTLQKIVDADPIEIAKQAKVDKRRIDAFQRSIIEVLGESLALERQQLARLKNKGVSTAPIERLYASSGVPLEHAIVDLLGPPFCSLTVTRIPKQRHGEADVKIILSSGHNGIGQVHAKEKHTDKVSVTKAMSILQQSPELNPQAFVFFGRPDFMDDSISQAQAHARNGKNIKLIPITALAEMYVRFHEEKITPARVAAILESETGHITLNRL